MQDLSTCARYQDISILTYKKRHLKEIIEIKYIEAFYIRKIQNIFTL